MPSFNKNISERDNPSFSTLAHIYIHIHTYTHICIHIHTYTLHVTNFNFLWSIFIFPLNLSPFAEIAPLPPYRQYSPSACWHTTWQASFACYWVEVTIHWGTRSALAFFSMLFSRPIPWASTPGCKLLSGSWMSCSLSVPTSCSPSLQLPNRKSAKFCRYAWSTSRTFLNWSSVITYQNGSGYFSSICVLKLRLSHSLWVKIGPLPFIDVCHLPCIWPRVELVQMICFLGALQADTR